jgi:hypothetical protein
MSHNITLYCGCIVYVACHPPTGVAHTRVLERRHPLCRVRKHEIGLRLALWELLPEPIDQWPFPPIGNASSAARRPASCELKAC